ncbi:Alpha-mannosidase 2 [Sparganum proliferum]
MTGGSRSSQFDDQLNFGSEIRSAVARFEPNPDIHFCEVIWNAELLADQYRKKATLYNNGGVVLVPLGDDFRYQSEFAWEAQFNNYKKLMDYINSKPEMRMHVQFGTLSTYFNLVEKLKPVANFPSLIGDFFTYADRNHDYWSGFYTSRPAHKALSRVLEAELRSAEILFSLARHWQPSLASELKSQTLRSLYRMISSARRSLALFQHHDAITGTARRHVMDDYRRQLSSALDASRTVAGASLSLLLGFGLQAVEKAANAQLLDPDSTLLHSAGWDWSVPGTPTPPTITFTSLDQVRYVVLFNNHAQKRDHIVRVDIDLGKVLRTESSKRRLVSVRVTNDGAYSSPETLHQLEPSPDQISSNWGEPGRLVVEVENILDLTYPNDNDEVVMKLSTGIENTNRAFFTDSNCFQFMRRVFHDKIPLQGNIYPMTCAAYIEDAHHRITLLSAQSLGFMAGEHPGEMNVWLDRRLAQGDGRGLGEGVLDNVPTRSVFRILVETVSPASRPADASGSNERSEFVRPRPL